VAIFGVQGWRWDLAREVRALAFALDADAAGQQQWRQLARQAALRGKRVAVLPAAAYGECKDISEAWTTGVLTVGARPAAAPGDEALAVPQRLRESWAERVAIMVIDGGLPHEEAERLAWAGLQTPDAAPGGASCRDGPYAPGLGHAAAGQTVSTRGCTGVSIPRGRPACLDGHQTTRTRAPRRVLHGALAPVGSWHALMFREERPVPSDT
jgi:hypothetical protein